MYRYILVILILLAIIGISIRVTDGADIRVFMEHGGMSLEENDISEGHKSYHKFGLETSVERLRGKFLVGGEYFFRGEPADEDPELLQQGFGIYGRYFYKLNDSVQPYIGVRFDHYARDFNDKHDTSIQEDTIDFFSADGGARFKWKWLWVDAGTTIPFYTNTKSGNFGPDVGIGFKWKSLDVGYRFKQVVFTDHHFKSGKNDLKFYFSGMQVGWTF